MDAGKRNTLAEAEPRGGLLEEGDPLSGRRTELAVHRTRLAEERTFAAWVRTGLAAIAGGLAIARLLYESQMPPLASVVALALTVVGGGAFLLGWWTYSQGIRALVADGEPVAPRWVVNGLSILLLGSALASVVLIVS